MATQLRSRAAGGRILRRRPVRRRWRGCRETHPPGRGRCRNARAPFEAAFPPRLDGDPPRSWVWRRQPRTVGPWALGRLHARARGLAYAATAGAREGRDHRLVAGDGANSRDGRVSRHERVAKPTATLAQGAERLVGLVASDGTNRRNSRISRHERVAEGSTAGRERGGSTDVAPLVPCYHAARTARIDGVRFFGRPTGESWRRG